MHAGVGRSTNLDRQGRAQLAAGQQAHAVQVLVDQPRGTQGREDWYSPVDGNRMGAYHTLEIPFVFNNVDVGASMTGAGSSCSLPPRSTSAARTAAPPISSLASAARLKSIEDVSPATRRICSLRLPDQKLKKQQPRDIATELLPTPLR